jgi:ERCC4-type nuclease
MLIKVDCREKEIYTKITNVVSTTDKIGGGSKKLNTATKTKSAPRFHIMDLGDGMTIQVPIPASMEKGSKGSRGNGGGNGNGTGEKSLEHEELTQEKDEETDKIMDNVGGGVSRHKIISARMPIGDMSIEWENENNHGDATDATGARATATAPAEAGIYVLFERKTLYDLAASIKDGRYKEQSFRLENTILHNHDIVYIIEGDLSRYDERRGGISKTAIQSAMVSLLYYKGFSVYRTMNTDETAAFIMNFADKIESNCSSSSKRETEMAGGGGLGYYRCRTVPGNIPPGEGDDGYSEVAVKKEKRDFITPKNIGEIMLSNIPGVSPKIAAAIMKKYNNSMFEFLHDLKRKNDIFEESISNTNKSPIPSKILAECFADIEIHMNKEAKCIEGDMNSENLGKEAIKESSSNSRDKHQIRKIGKATIDKIYKYLC